MGSGGERTACPVCGQVDQTQPVQAIVDQQVTHASGQGDMFGVGWVGSQVAAGTATKRTFSTARSQLAGMVDLPEPSPPRSRVGLGAALLAAFVGIPLVLGLAMSEAGTVDDWNPWELSLALLVGVWPGVAIGIGLIVAHMKRRRAWEQEVALWERALPVWMALRYCHRDHVVYQPPNVYIAPADTREFVYDTVM